MTPNFDLTGKVALITGGSRGLGREIVRGYAAAGADVVIASRNLESCEKLAAEIEKTTDRKAFPYSCHMGSWDQIDGMIEAVYDRFGKIDILVNNAGMSPMYDRLENVSEALYDKVFAVNLKGPFRLAAVVGARMAEGQGGVIINVSSTGSIRPRAGIVPYAAAKAGLNTLTQGLANTFGPKVRVNCIMCGPFFSDISKSWDMKAFAERAKTFALGRGGEPEEIVGAALYFASDASSFCTGSILRLDGGLP